MGQEVEGEGHNHELFLRFILNSIKLKHFTIRRKKKKKKKNFTTGRSIPLDYNTQEKALYIIFNTVL